MKLKSLKLGDYFRYAFSIDEPIVKGDCGTIYSGLVYEVGPIENKRRLVRVVNGPRHCFAEDLETEVYKVFKHIRFDEVDEL